MIAAELHCFCVRNEGFPDYHPLPITQKVLLVTQAVFDGRVEVTGVLGIGLNTARSLAKQGVPLRDPSIPERAAIEEALSMRARKILERVAEGLAGSGQKAYSKPN